MRKTILAALVLLAAGGCLTEPGIRTESVRDIDVSSVTVQLNRSPGTYNPEQGLRPAAIYYLEVSAGTESGEIISNPDHRDFILSSTDSSISDIRYEPEYIRFTTDSPDPGRIERGAFSFTLGIRDNPWPGTAETAGM